MTKSFPAYEDFSEDVESQPRYLISADAIEDERLKSFERGYRAGCSDVEQSLQTNQEALFSQIEDLVRRFDQEKAELQCKLHAMISNALEAIFDLILPDLVCDLTGKRVTALINDMSSVIQSANMTIRCSSDIRPLNIPQIEDADIQIEYIDTLSKGELEIKVGDIEARFDPDQIRHEILQAIHEKISIPTKENANE